jgi:hypothetical protein
VIDPSIGAATKNEEMRGGERERKRVVADRVGDWWGRGREGEGREESRLSQCPISSPLRTIVPLWTRPMSAEDAMMMKRVAKEAQIGDSFVDTDATVEEEDKRTGK